MAQALMPGETHYEILERIHRYLAPESYLEIGVQSGASLTFAARGTRAVGIDPHPRIIHPIGSRAKLFPMTSDAFFERFDLLAELETDRLALAFIDGLHHFEQVLKDFRHIERYADTDTVVLIHDCYPVSAPAATRECRTSFWCGDVWKVVPCLRSLRPDLNLRIIPSYPSGLALITGIDRDNRDASLTDDRQLDAFRDMDFDDMARERESWPEVVANDWPSIEALLPTGSQWTVAGRRHATDPS